MRRLLLISCLLCGVAFGYPAESSNTAAGPLEEGLEMATSFLKGCGDKDLGLCLKMRALTYVDGALRRGDIALTEGVTLVRTDRTGPQGRALDENELDKQLPQDPQDKDNQVESMLVDRMARFLQTHTLQFKVPDSSIQEVRKSLDEARGKKKKLKMLLPFLLMLKLKAAALIPLALGALALLAFKALIVGKLALVLSALIGLQKLLGSKHSTQSYEVVAHPHYSEDHGHYGRSAQDIAYSAHVK